MKRNRHLYAGGIALSLAILLVAIASRDVAGQRPAVATDADDIGGVVTGPRGPEAGVWVIAETTNLPTKFITNRRHRRSGTLPRPRPAEGQLQRLGAGLRPGRFVKDAGAAGPDAEPDGDAGAERRRPRPSTTRRGPGCR